MRQTVEAVGLGIGLVTAPKSVVYWIKQALIMSLELDGNFKLVYIYLRMKKNYKRTMTIIIVIICFIVLAFFGGMLGAGPYGYAQQYEFNVSKNQLIKTVEAFKSQNKSFNLPEGFTETDLLDTLTSQFNVHVYYDNGNTAVYFFIDSKPENPNKSYINLVSVNEGLQERPFKIVNKDFNRTENLRVKKEFEDKILNKLKLPYKDAGNGMFIFWK